MALHSQSRISPFALGLFTFICLQAEATTMSANVALQTATIVAVHGPMVIPTQQELFERLQCYIETSIDIERKTQYQDHLARAEELKSELYGCLYSNGWNQDLMDLLDQYELPHQAFRAARERFGDSFTSLFNDHPNLVRTGKNGTLFLTRAGMSAWSHMQCEQLDTWVRDIVGSDKQHPRMDELKTALGFNPAPAMAKAA